MIAFLFGAMIFAHASCRPELSLDQVMLRHASGVADLERVHTRILNELAWFKVWGGRPWRKVCGDRTSPISSLYTGVISARSRGLHEFAEEGVRELIKELRAVLGKSFDIGTFRRQLEQVWSDPDVDRQIGFALPIVKGARLPEQIFAEYARDLLNTDRQMVTGPHQAEMVRLIHQFGHRESNERLLYLGQGAPAILTASASVQRSTQYLGFDPQAPTARTHDFLNRINARVIRADLDRNLLAHALSAAPYRVVAAVDLVTENPYRRDVLGLTGLNLARALRELLAPAGTLIILNDFGNAPSFTHEEAVRAGFEIVRWGADRRLADALIPHVYPDRLDRAGRLRAFVLRNGRERRPPELKMTFVDR